VNTPRNRCSCHIIIQPKRPNNLPDDDDADDDDDDDDDDGLLLDRHQ